MPGIQYSINASYYFIPNITILSQTLIILFLKFSKSLLVSLPTPGHSTNYENLPQEQYASSYSQSLEPTVVPHQIKPYILNKVLHQYTLTKPKLIYSYSPIQIPYASQTAQYLLYIATSMSLQIPLN